MRTAVTQFQGSELNPQYLKINVLVKVIKCNESEFLNIGDDWDKEKKYKVAW